MDASHQVDSGEVVRRLKRDDAEEYWVLRLEALEKEPAAFGMSPEEHRSTTVADVAERVGAPPAQASTFGAFVGGSMVGIATLLLEARIKERHKAHLVGVYLREEARGRGLAKRLLAAVLECAREQAGLEQVLLGVRVGNTAARSLYSALGFVSWGVEPRALRVGGSYFDEEQMILRLRP